jgi:hypothetical protein
MPSVAQQNGTNVVPPEATPESRHEADAPAITPADVYARMSPVHSSIELIRFVMGKQKTDGLVFTVTGAAPREVYFQAITVFRKANRLSFEQTREVASTPAPPVDDTDPGSVLAVVNAAHERISYIKDRLEITTAPAPQQSDSSKTPTDIFRSIVLANRQLNVLLDESFAPSEVFQQVTLAVGYAARLRSRFPGDRIPEAPALVVGKQPQDVFLLLIESFSLIRGIAVDSGLDILELQVIDEPAQNLSPSDVYDIASLVVSELAYINSQLDDTKPPRHVYFPGRKFPSDIYQRAGILQAQLLELRELVIDDPDWLRRPNADR